MHTRAGDSAAWPPSPVAAVAVLLDAGADAHTPTFKDTRLPLVCRGSTPLHIAAALGYEAVCVTLLSRTERSALGTAADPRLACNRWGLTPVDIALLASRHHLAHLLSPPRSTRSAQQQLVPPASSRVHGTAGYLLPRAQRGLLLRVSLLLQLRDVALRWAKQSAGGEQSSGRGRDKSRCRGPGPRLLQPGGDCSGVRTPSASTLARWSCPPPHAALTHAQRNLGWPLQAKRRCCLGCSRWSWARSTHCWS